MKLEPVRLPAQEWKLSTGMAGNKLLQTHWFEDLYFWRLFELSKTVLGSRVKKYLVGKCDLLFSPQGQAGLKAFMGLWPEWPESLYMRISRKTRASRLLAVYGDVALTLESRLDEIPPDLSKLLLDAQLAGSAPIIRGQSLVDLVLLKIPRFLPASHRNRFVTEYLNLIYGDDQSLGVHLRIDGRGGVASRYRRELELTGRYRLYEANGFNLRRTVLAAHDDLKRPDRIFRRSRKFLEGLLVSGEQFFDPLFGVIGHPPRIKP
jgi:hypothetical protein